MVRPNQTAAAMLVWRSCLSLSSAAADGLVAAGCLMSPTEHFYRAARYGFIAFLAAGALVAVVFFTRRPDGRVHLVAWASLLREAGLSAGVAHFLLWTVAMVFMGCCGGGMAWAFCRCVPARCPRCGGAAYWQAVGSWAYRCRDCGHLHETGLGGKD